MSRNVWRALITSFVVGPILTVINQTPVLTALMRDEYVPAIAWLRIALTFVVPFLVSLVSASMADRAREA